MFCTGIISGFIIMKNILYVEQNIDGTIGGSHYCLLYLIQNLDRNKFKPFALFHQDNSLIQTFQNECETQVISLNSYYKISNRILQKLLNFTLNFWYIIKCALIIKSKRIDLIHLNNSIGGGYDTWLLAAKFLNVPCITHERNYINFNHKHSKLFSMLGKKFTKVLAVSNFIRDNLSDNLLDKSNVVTVYDGIDVKRFRDRITRPKSDVRNEFHIDEADLVIGMIGNIREWKGQAYLIEALKLVARKFSNVKCILVGDIAKNNSTDIKYLDTLKSRVNEYGLIENVIFTGFRDDVPDIANIFDIQINASIEPDPFPHVILEGMSIGNPIISTNLGGAKESIIHGETGYLIGLNETTIFAEYITDLLNNEDKRNFFSKNAVAHINNFSLDINVENTVNIYNDALD